MSFRDDFDGDGWGTDAFHDGWEAGPEGFSDFRDDWGDDDTATWQNPVAGAYGLGGDLVDGFTDDDEEHDGFPEALGGSQRNSEWLEDNGLLDDFVAAMNDDRDDFDRAWESVGDDPEAFLNRDDAETAAWEAEDPADDPTWNHDEAELPQELAETLGGEGSVAWSKSSDEDWSDEQVDEIKEAVEGFRDDFETQGGNRDDWGVPEQVLDDPRWEESNRDQFNYYDLQDGDRALEAGSDPIGSMSDDEFWDEEQGPFAPEFARDKWNDEHPDDDHGAYPMTQSEDLIAMQEELLELELENAQNADQSESDTLQHPEDTEADRQDDEDEHRHDTGPGTK